MPVISFNKKITYKMTRNNNFNVAIDRSLSVEIYYSLNYVNDGQKKVTVNCTKK